MNEKNISAPEKMADILNFGSVNLAMAIGYELGIFDFMDEADAPLSPAKLSEKTGLSERYLREWLPIMASAGVMALVVADEEKMDGNDDAYLLHKEWADILTRRAGGNNMGEYAREIPLLTLLAKERVMEGFRTGKGVSYEHYGPFRDFMGALAVNKHESVLVNVFLPSVDIGAMMEKLKKGISVMDLGCGDGTAAVLMAAAFPNSRFTGIDISEEMLAVGRGKAEKEGLGNIDFVLCDAGDPAMAERFNGCFDYVTAFDAIHDQTAPLQALKNANAALKPGGVFSMIDIAAETSVVDNLNHSMGPFLYTVSLMHCMPVGLHDSGAGLGMMWGRQKAVTLLKEAGFTDVAIHAIPNDGFNDHYLCRK